MHSLHDNDKEKKLMFLFLLHVLCLLVALLPYWVDGTEAFAELFCFAAVLYPMSLFLERKRFALASLLTVSTLSHLLASLCRLYPTSCPTIDWQSPKEALFLFSVYHLLSYVAVSKQEMEVLFPVLQLAALLSLQSSTIQTACILLSIALCVARSLSNFKAYHSEDLVLFLVVVSVAAIFQTIELRSLSIVFFALTFAASVDVKKGSSKHFLGLLGTDAGFVSLSREDL